MSYLDAFNSEEDNKPTQISGSRFWQNVQADTYQYNRFLTYIKLFYNWRERGNGRVTTEELPPQDLQLDQQDCADFLKLQEAVARYGISNIIRDKTLVEKLSSSLIDTDANHWSSIDHIRTRQDGWSTFRQLFNLVYDRSVPDCLNDDANMIKLFHSGMNALRYEFNGVIDHTRKYFMPDLRL